MTYNYTPTTRTQMKNTDGVRYVCGCMELIDTVRHCLDLVSIQWLLPQLLAVLTTSFSNPLETVWAASHPRSQWLMAGGRKGLANLTQLGTILRGILIPHPSPRLLSAPHCSSPSPSVQSYFIPQKLVPVALHYKNPARWALSQNLHPREPGLWHVQSKLLHIACYCINWSNHLRKWSTEGKQQAHLWFRGSTPGYLSGRNEHGARPRKLRMRMFTAALFTTDPNWEKHKRPLTVDCINKVCS